MQQWWIRNKDAIPDKYKAADLDKDTAADLDEDTVVDLDEDPAVALKTFKSDVENITGCIPLLLDKCIMNGKIDLTAPKLLQVFDQVQFFMVETKRDKHIWDT
jgi:hypothetical protein